MKKLILIIDDDEALTEEIKDILIDEGYQVSIAYDGKQGAKQFDALKPDLVILDIKLPEIDGLTLLSQFKNKASKTPIIMLTGHPINTPLTHITEFTLADHFMNKPFDVSYLLEMIKTMIKAYNK